MKNSVMDKLDPELKTYYLQVKDEVKKEHTTYISKHPEVRQLLNDFLSTLLLEKPEDVYSFSQEYFSFFNTNKEAAQQKPLVLSGPSAVGKETLISMLLKHFPETFELNKTYTSKELVDEKDKENYAFLSAEDFTSEITKHNFLEYSEINGHLYGTHKGFIKEVMEKGKICLIKVDIRGAERIHKSSADCVHVWVDPPSLDSLKERMALRQKEGENLEEKVEKAENETKEAKRSSFYNKYVVNKDLQACFTGLVECLRDLYPDVTLKQ